MQTRTAIACATLAVASSSAAAEVTLAATWNPGSGQLNAIGFSNGVVYARGSGDNFITLHNADGSSAGANLGFVPGNGNDSDIDFAATDMNIGGTMVAAGTMLVTQGEVNPQTLYAVDTATNTVVAQRTLDEPIGQLVGGSHDPVNGTLVTTDWSNDVIRVFDTETGQAINSFGFGMGFDTFFGDVDVAAATGDLYLVSSSQSVIRVLSSTGEVLRDIDVGSLGVGGMSGIALDDATGDAWISSTNGNVYHLRGVIPEPGVFAMLAGGVIVAATRRRR